MDTLRQQTEAQLKEAKAQMLKGQLATQAMLNALKAMRPNDPA